MRNIRWLLPLCCFTCHQAFAQFEVMNIPADGFVETACGNEMCIVVDSKTFIAKTYNLGDSFISVVNPREFTSRTDVQHTKDSTFYIVAYRTDTMQQTVIFRTQDAGSNWQQLFHEPHYPNVFYMHDDSFGIVGNGIGSLYRTTDGWQTFNITQYSINTQMESAFFLNDSVGFVGAKGSALFTVDSGNNWVGGRFFNSGTFIRGFSKTDDTTIFATGGPNQQNWAHIYRSNDMGVTREIVFESKNRARRIYEIKCFPSGECIAVGWQGVDKTGLLYRTLDNGDSWYEITVPTDKKLYNLEFANDSIAFIGGEEGTLIRMNRNLLPPPPDTTDSASAIFEINENTDVQVYPNPFDNQLSIHSNHLILEIQICSVLGKMLSPYTYSGLKMTTLSTEFLSDGLYLLRIKTEKGAVTKRIVKTSH